MLDGSVTASGFWARTHKSGDMGWLELRAVIFAIRAFGEELAGEEVLVWCDNAAIVAAVNSKTSKTPRIMTELRHLQEALDALDTSVRAWHVFSRVNTWADALSRQRTPTGWAVTARLFRELECRFGAHSVELFSTENRAHVERFHSTHRAPGAESTEPFTWAWEKENALIVPPFDQLARVAQRLVEAPSNATVVAPFWPTQSWFIQLAGVATTTLKFPAGDGLVTAGRPGEDRRAPWPTVVFRVQSTN